MPKCLLTTVALVALATCDGDSAGTGGVLGPSFADRALDLRNDSEDPGVFAPGSWSHFDSTHRTGVVTIEV